MTWCVGNDHSERQRQDLDDFEGGGLGSSHPVLRSIIYLCLGRDIHKVIHSALGHERRRASHSHGCMHYIPVPVNPRSFLSILLPLV